MSFAMSRGASNFFLSQRTGRWRWVWLLVSFPAGLIAAVAVLLTSFAALEVARALGVAGTGEVSDHFFSDEFAYATTPHLVAVELLLLGGSLWIAATGASLVHGRSVRSLIEPLRRFDWSIVRRVLTVQAGLTLAVAPSFLLPWLDTPDFTGVGGSDLVWFVPLALLTLVQTSGEDVFFKGYLLRQLGAASKVYWFAPTVVVLVFVSIHIGNPDFQTGFWMLLPLFVVSELIVIYLTMRTGGMEVALCWHWFNNATIFLLVAERATQANDVTLFVFDEDPTTIVDDAVTNGLYAAVLVIQLLAFLWRRSPFFLEPHNWTPRTTSVDKNRDYNHSADSPH